eukprot:CAMPEP_0181172046 /NCGR_PEP_ID=MMETSP1096-20121128/2243_1 /TAXON_ID=156174 ORGANISM="Chrysochromulina ericina, Strain CCMP281" /NCGR_SAMPLE_ID=MMETSP1096 /ASSEMBLY_ACC=CAM_ASM_000453 /LENGTH=55 /DNA_ID=CAMNT_0023259753 /DNA_START=541 /DNA_END=708 /DNA_ORIENTATION=+
MRMGLRTRKPAIRCRPAAAPLCNNGSHTARSYHAPRDRITREEEMLPARSVTYIS